MNGDFIWSEQYSVDNRAMDDQHKHFFNIVSGLSRLSKGNIFTKEEALMMTGQLGSYAFYHLESEEALFNKTNYTNADNHMMVHDSFREEADKFMIRVGEAKEADIKNVVKEIAEYAGNWLKNHIMVMDKGYSVFLEKEKFE